LLRDGGVSFVGSLVAYQKLAKLVDGDTLRGVCGKRENSEGREKDPSAHCVLPFLCAATCRADGLRFVLPEFLLLETKDAWPEAGALLRGMH
jgi:hypothetical protein